MISPILPSHDADTVGLRVDLLIAQMAYDYRAPQHAIASAIVAHLVTAQIPNVSGPETDKKADPVTTPDPTPSQPGDASRSHAPAADTPDLPAGETDGEAGRPSVSASPSTDPITEAPKPLPDASVAPDDARPAEAKTSAEDALSSASGGVQGGLPAHPATPSPETATTGEDRESATATGESPVIPSVGDLGAHTPGGEDEVAHASVDNSENDAADEGGQRADAVALGSAVESGAPRSARPMTKGELVRACYAAHPDWPASKISAETGVLRNSVTAFASMFGLKLVSEADWLAAQGEKTTAALKTAVEAERSPAKRAVSKKGLFNLRDRFGEYLHKNLSTMTRVESSYWEGTAAEILALKEARPGLRELTDRPAK